jgi:hypothetical protein
MSASDQASFRNGYTNCTEKSAGANDAAVLKEDHMAKRKSTKVKVGKAKMKIQSIDESEMARVAGGLNVGKIGRVVSKEAPAIYKGAKAANKAGQFSNNNGKASQSGSSSQPRPSSGPPGRVFASYKGVKVALNNPLIRP